MPDINLSTLSGPELRRLLDGARARGQASLAHNILKEMEERRAGRGRQGAIPTRIVAVDLSDPMDAEDEPPPEPRPEPEADAEAPLYLAATPRPAPKAARARKKKPEPPAPNPHVPPPSPLELERVRRPARFPFGPAAGFAAGIAVGVAAGWGLANADLSRQAPPPPAAPPADFLQTAALVQPPAPAAPPPAPVAAQPQVPASEPVAAEFREASATEAPEPEAVAQAEPPPPKIVVLKTASAAKEGGDANCAAEPTPADRTICADPQLKKLQGELREAYGEALEAHEDRGLLRQRQLAWRDARNSVSDPESLARLYEQRIRKLHAAAEAARQEHER